jgi:APA family basic amino acid/polyamine antiporter
VTAPSSLPLERRLGPLDAAAIVISNVIGGGIFFVPVIVAQLVPHPRAMLAVWIAGGFFALAGAMAYAELAAARPHAGGEYVYLREAFGPLAGFLSGWTSFVAGFSGAIAAGALAFADYLGRFFPLAADAAPIVALPIPFAPLAVSPKTLVALVLIWGLTIVHVRGLGPGRMVQNALAAAKVLGLVVFLVAGWTLGHGDSGHWTGGEHVAPTGFLLALVPVMFAYSGWNAASYVAEEVRDPARNVPLSLAAGTIAVVIIYVGLNALYLYALPIDGLAAIDGTLIDRIAERLFGFTAAGLIAIFTLVSIAASISAMVLAGPRVYFAMARDGLFTARTARVHPRFRAPVAAIVAQTLWSSVLVLSGSLSELVSYTGFSILLFSSAAVASIFVLRRRTSGTAATFRAWGYPWAPIAFTVMGLVVVGNEIWRSPRPSLAGLAVIAAGLPVYVWLRAQKRRAMLR